MNKGFESFMAPQLRQFTAYRQQLGYKPDGIRSVLLDFDRYLQKHAVDQSQLTPEPFFLNSGPVSMKIPIRSIAFYPGCARCLPF